MKKKILYSLAALFVIIQFFRPAKNVSNDQTYHISTRYQIPDTVKHILQVACYDCHSNKTRYPWYSEVQPSAWWLSNHVKEAKSELNFSAFTNRKLAYQNHKFEEIIELVEEKEMPLPSYTWLGLHSDAKLTDEQRKLLTDWASAQMDMLKENYAADSLVMKRR
jgi:hypothetical protein